MKIRKDRLSPRYVATVSNFTVLLVGLVASLLVYYSTAYSLLKSFVYNADALYLPSLYADLLNGGDLSSWSLPPTPYIFPDMFLYFLVRTAVPNLHAAIVLFGMVQYLLFALGLMLLAKQAIPGSYGLARYSLVALMGVLFLSLISKLDFFSQMIFVSAFHFGVVLSIPFALAIVCKLTSESQLKVSHVCALSVLSFLVSASDGLYLVQVTAPLIGSLGLLFLMKKIDGKRAVIAGGAMLVASLAGLALVSTAVSKNGMIGTYLFRPHSISSSLSQLFHSLSSIWSTYPMHAVVAIGFLFICAFSLAKLLVQSFFDKEAVVNVTDVLLPSYFLLAFVFNVLVIIGLGVFADRQGLRYFLPFLIFSGFWGLPFVLRIPPIVRPVLLEWTVLGIFAFLVLLLVRSIDRQPAANIFANAYYPDYIRCIDEKTAQMGIKHGIAQYWQARPLSMLTQNELSVVQVTRDLSPYYWINSLAWYEIEPEFAIVDLSLPEGAPFRLDESLITNRFGEPDAVFQCEHSKVMVYRRPDSELRILFGR